MGFKNLKEHYRIEHIVQVVPDKGICIGSPYIHDIIVVGFDDTIRKKDFGNVDLDRYMREMEADLDKLREVVQSSDTFAASITVYTYDGGTIIETQCEKPGWPNVTHEGYVMYENTYSTDKKKVVKWAKDNAACGVRLASERVEEAKARLVQAESDLAEEKADVAKLDADYPPKRENP